MRVFGPAALAILLAILLAAAAPEPAGFRLDHYNADVPATLRGARVVSSGELARMLADGTPHPVLVDVLPAVSPPDDARPEMKRMPLPHRNIPGSVWLPDTGRGVLSQSADQEFKAALAKASGGSISRPMVFYCRAHCWMSWNAAKRALQYGYSNVIWYPDGADGWAAAGHATVVSSPWK